MKNLVTALVFFAIVAAVWGAETWLDARRFDRTQAALIAVIAGGMVVLMVALILHFGRFA